MWFVYAVLLPAGVGMVTTSAMLALRFCLAVRRGRPMAEPSGRKEFRIIADLASQHLLPTDGFSKWLDEYLDDGGGSPWHQDDLEEAFTAGFHLAFWVTMSRVADVSESFGQVAAGGTGSDRNTDKDQAEPLKDP